MWCGEQVEFHFENEDLFEQGSNTIRILLGISCGSQLRSNSES